MIKKTYKQSAIVLLCTAVVAAFFEWKRWPLSIIIGGALALANLKAMSWGVEGLIGTDKASGKLIFFSMFRLLLIFVILIAFLILKLINILGVLIGFTVVFSVLIKEGLVHAREEK